MKIKTDYATAILLTITVLYQEDKGQLDIRSDTNKEDTLPNFTESIRKNS